MHGTNVKKKTRSSLSSFYKGMNSGIIKSTLEQGFGEMTCTSHREI